MSPRRRVPDPWPWPEDTPIVRRERVAWGYREALSKTDPHLARQIDQRCAEWGQTWILGDRQRLDDDALLTTDEVADHFDVRPRTVDQWHHRDGLPAVHTPDGIRYRYGAVLGFYRDRRRRWRRRDRAGASA